MHTGVGKKKKKQVLEKYQADVMAVQLHYLSHGMYSKGRRVFGINSTQFHSFCKDCQLKLHAMSQARPAPPTGMLGGARRGVAGAPSSIFGDFRGMPTSNAEG